MKIEFTYSEFICHGSPESNLVNLPVPEKPTTDSESPWHGDFRSEVGFGASSCATDSTLCLYPKGFPPNYIRSLWSRGRVPGS